MSLQDDINTVRNFIKGSCFPDWPEPTNVEDYSGRYQPWKAFERICDQMSDVLKNRK